MENENGNACDLKFSLISIAMVFHACIYFMFGIMASIVSAQKHQPPPECDGTDILDWILATGVTYIVCGFVAVLITHYHWHYCVAHKKYFNSNTMQCYFSTMSITLVIGFHAIVAHHNNFMSNECKRALRLDFSPVLKILTANYILGISMICIMIITLCSQIYSLCCCQIRATRQNRQMIAIVVPI